MRRELTDREMGDEKVEFEDWSWRSEAASDFGEALMVAWALSAVLKSGCT